jgi:hypothetical protein
MPSQDTDPVSRFWKNVEKTDSCWNWTGDKVFGYGRMNIKRKTVRAHRFGYELLVGPIPDGLVIDHLCRNRACVNPAHLEPVTNRVNVLRGVGFPAVNAVKTHCRYGHEFTANNTVIRSNGDRRCRICRRISHNKYRQDKKLKAAR